MLTFPNAKINLGLHVLEKKNNGYHEIETIFYPLKKVYDALEILKSNTNEITALGTALDINPEENLVYRAMQKMQSLYPNITENHIILQKSIPAGAGLGGGSADAAFVLTMLNSMYQLHLTDNQLIDIAKTLGADVPFFVLNTPSLATGIGENLSPIVLDLSTYEVRLITSKIHIPTAWAFSQIKPSSERPSLREVVEKPIEEWKDSLHNDFEPIVFKKYPELQQNKELLYNQGAIYASLTGTGSAVYGIFKNSTP